MLFRKKKFYGSKTIDWYDRIDTIDDKGIDDYIQAEINILANKYKGFKIEGIFSKRKFQETIIFSYNNIITSDLIN